MTTKKKNPALVAYGKVGGRKRNALLLKRIGASAYRKHFSDLAKKRWQKE